MFTVENADFIADKLAAELLPDQEYREVAKNAEEAIRRRIAVEGGGTGRIEFDVDWSMLEARGNWYVCCADDGDGMTKNQLERYTTTLAVQGAGNNQTIGGNQGMGLKISGPTRNKEGVLIRTLRDGQSWAVQVGWNKEHKQYDLIPLGIYGEKIIAAAPESFPAFIQEAGHGSVVTFLGNTDNDNTFTPPGKRGGKGWLMKYLHRRFFRFTDGDITMVVRVPSGDESAWPRSRAEADLRMSKQGKSFNFTRVRGTAAVWDDAADKPGGARGSVELPGDPVDGVPGARMHWWVMPGSTTGYDVSSRTESPGSLAVLFQNELHDWRTGAQANAFFARLGIIFGKARVGLIVEPLGPSVTSDFARAHVLVDGVGVFDGDAWPCWADQFRKDLPEKIREAMDEEQSRLQDEDPDRAKRIRDRLKDIMSLLRPRRFRPNPAGATRASGTASSSQGTGEETVERSTGQSTRKRSSNTRGIGAALANDDPNGEPAEEIFSANRLDALWVTEAYAEGQSLVHAPEGMHDRAAALAGEDGISASILLLNTEFRGYRALLEAVNEAVNPEGDRDKATLIESSVQEWTEQKMLEAVNGLRQLENGSSWTANSYDEALSPTSLTAAFMADRYHTLREVKRQVGNLRAAA